MEDDFFPLQSRSAWHMQPPAPSTGQVLLGTALQGHVPVPPCSPHPPSLLFFLAVVHAC